MVKSSSLSTTTPIISSTKSTTKGNNGKGARRRFWYKIYTIIGSVLCTIIIIRIYEFYIISSSSSSSDDEKKSSSSLLLSNRITIPKVGNQLYHDKKKQLLLRKQQQQQQSSSSKDENNNNGGIYEKRGDVIPEGILNGSLHLIDVQVNHEEVVSSNCTSGVYGTFCHIDWYYHKKNPSIYPMFKDLIKISEDHGTCYDTRIERIPILPLVTDLQEYYDNLSFIRDDANNRTNAAAAVALRIGGFVFHESRCGSTLVANLLASSYPDRHRVYSESPPPIIALQVCGEYYEYCSIDIAASIFRTVIYLMSRRQQGSSSSSTAVNDEMETTVFFKIQSIGSRAIRTFLHALPTTPWIFVYRDPIHVMMSHLKYGYRHANCIRAHRRPPTSVINIVSKYNNISTTGSKSAAAAATTTVRNLVPEHYCAAHLASITESIITNYNPRTGIVINYSNLIQQLHTTIFPYHFHIDLSSNTDVVQRMNDTASKYSKGRGMANTNSFTADNQQKEEMANDVVKQAVALYLQPSYIQLEQLAK